MCQLRKNSMEMVLLDIWVMTCREYLHLQYKFAGQLIFLEGLLTSIPACAGQAVIRTERVQHD